jgi:hypothetical protein
MLLPEEVQTLLQQANILQAQIKLLSLPCAEARASLTLRVEMSTVLYHTAKVIDHLRIIDLIRLPDVLASIEETPIIERGTTNDERVPPSA